MVGADYVSNRSRMTLGSVVVARLVVVVTPGPHGRLGPGSQHWVLVVTTTCSCRAHDKYPGP